MRYIVVVSLLLTSVAYIGQWTVVLCTAGVGLLVFLQTRSATAHAHHSHLGNNLWKTAIHESSHWFVAKELGCQPLEAVINSDGSGHVIVKAPGGSPIVNAAISFAGGYGEGTFDRSRRDLQNVQVQLSAIPKGQRANAEAEARRLAKSIVRNKSDRINELAEKLLARGRL